MDLEMGMFTDVPIVYNVMEAREETCNEEGLLLIVEDLIIQRQGIQIQIVGVAYREIGSRSKSTGAGSARKSTKSSIQWLSDSGDVSFTVVSVFDIGRHEYIVAHRNTQSRE